MLWKNSLVLQQELAFLSLQVVVEQVSNKRWFATATVDAL